MSPLGCPLGCPLGQPTPERVPAIEFLVCATHIARKQGLARATSQYLRLLDCLHRFLVYWSPETLRDSDQRDSIAASALTTLGPDFFSSLNAGQLARLHANFGFTDRVS